MAGNQGSNSNIYIDLHVCVKPKGFPLRLIFYLLV